jgi:transposase
MANQLKVETQNAIQALKTKGWSQRRIARELGIDRETVARYWEPLIAAKPAISTPGDPGLEPKPAISTSGVCGRKSLCAELAAPIRAKVEAGLTAQRIYQDLKQEVGFTGSYQAVKRFVRKLKKTLPPQVWRVEVQPGEEAQVDFGTGAPLIDDQGRRRRTWCFRLVLSYSRKGYTEAVLRQDTETFIRCLENAFRALGGVPRTLNTDNLKAAVLKADWADPELNPKLAAFCRHYDTILLPCKPRTPEHKGKCENGVKYVQSNALAGRTFGALAEQNQHLAHWERTVADVRIHGTTRQQVAQRFAQEQPALLPLPPSLFPVFKEAQRTVHRDSYVEVDKAYYAVPPEYIGQPLWVRWDDREVRVFNARWDQLCLHARLEPGRFSKVLGIGGGQGTLQANLAYWLGRVQVLGSDCAHWAQTLVHQRGVAGMRALMGLAALTAHHSYKALNTACAKAQAQGTWRLRDVRQLLQSPHAPTQMTFLEDHPLIRDLREYNIYISTNQNNNP